MGRLLGRIWVGSTVSLISFIGYSSQLFIVWPSFDGEWSRELLETLVPFNFLLALLYCNYFMCVVTNPGTVPVNWVSCFVLKSRRCELTPGLTATAS